MASDAEVSIAATYRYLHESLQVMAAHTPDLHDVLARARRWACPSSV